MSQKKAKRLRRYARQAAKEAGFTPQNVWKTAFANLRPKPKWMPGWLWAKLLAWLFYKTPSDVIEGRTNE